MSLYYRCKPCKSEDDKEYLSTEGRKMKGNISMSFWAIKKKTFHHL